MIAINKVLQYAFKSHFIFGRFFVFEFCIAYLTIINWIVYLIEKSYMENLIGTRIHREVTGKNCRNNVQLKIGFNKFIVDKLCKNVHVI